MRSGCIFAVVFAIGGLLVFPFLAPIVLHGGDMVRVGAIAALPIVVVCGLTGLLFGLARSRQANERERKTLAMQPDSRPIAHPLNFAGPEEYVKSFEGTGFGVVFEDEGDTGYLYATNEDHTEIFDAVHLYNATDPRRLQPGEEAYIVWNPTLSKAGIFYHDRFQAIIDFANRRACCRTGFPPPHGVWRTPHDWDETMVAGLL
jgi:hypothetical protein